MALRKIIEIEGEAVMDTKAGFVSLGEQKTAFPAYCKVVNVSGGKTSGNATVNCVYEKYNVTQQFPIPFSVEDGALNFIKQAYVHLKTLPEWADATDC